MDAPTEQRSKEEYLLLYAATRRAMDRVELDNNERRLMGVVLDCSYGWGKPWMVCNGNRDLKTLTGIELKNQPRSLNSLMGKRMLQMRRTPREKMNRDGNLILEPLPDTRLWFFETGQRRIDERVYYACLAGLRVLNGLTPIECQAMELWQRDANLAEMAAQVSREDAVHNARQVNLPTRGETAKTMAADPLHEVRSGPQVAVDLSRANRESAEAETQMDVGEAPKAPLTFSAMVEKGWSEEQVAAYVAAHPEILSRAKSFSPGALQESARITPAERAPENCGTHGEQSGTHGKYLNHEISLRPGVSRVARPEIPGEVLMVSTKTTHGEYPGTKTAIPVLTVSTPLGGMGGNIGQCPNASSKKHLTMFIGRVRAREVLLERGAPSRELGKLLEAAGVFVGPAGEYYAPFWYKKLREARQAVEDCFFDLIKKVQEDGVNSVDTPGGFMVDLMKRRGCVRARE